MAHRRPHVVDVDEEDEGSTDVEVVLDEEAPIVATVVAGPVADEVPAHFGFEPCFTKDAAGNATLPALEVGVVTPRGGAPLTAEARAVLVSLCHGSLSDDFVRGVLARGDIEVHIMFARRLYYANNTLATPPAMERMFTDGRTRRWRVMRTREGATEARLMERGARRTRDDAVAVGFFARHPANPNVLEVMCVTRKLRSLRLGTRLHDVFLAGLTPYGDRFAFAAATRDLNADPGDTGTVPGTSMNFYRRLGYRVYAPAAHGIAYTDLREIQLDAAAAAAAEAREGPVPEEMTTRRFEWLDAPGFDVTVPPGRYLPSLLLRTGSNPQRAFVHVGMHDEADTLLMVRHRPPRTPEAMRMHLVPVVDLTVKEEHDDVSLAHMCAARARAAHAAVFEDKSRTHRYAFHRALGSRRG